MKDELKATSLPPAGAQLRLVRAVAGEMDKQKLNAG